MVMDIEAARIIRSKRRTISLEITRDATLVIRAPFRASERYILGLLEKRRSWIHKKLAQQRARVVPSKQFVNEEEFLYLGVNYRLRIAPGHPASLTLDGAFLLNSARASKAREEFIRWYAERAGEIVPERASFYGKASGLSYSRVNITNARRRWGSCSSNDGLNFSWRLVMAPIEVIDYVVAHEVAHLAVRSHSRRFWGKVAQLFPGYRECGRWLKENGHLLSL